MSQWLLNVHSRHSARGEGKFHRSQELSCFSWFSIGNRSTCTRFLYGAVRAVVVISVCGTLPISRDQICSGLIPHVLHWIQYCSSVPRVIYSLLRCLRPGINSWHVSSSYRIILSHQKSINQWKTPRGSNSLSTDCVFNLGTIGTSSDQTWQDRLCPKKIKSEAVRQHLITSTCMIHQLHPPSLYRDTGQRSKQSGNHFTSQVICLFSVQNDWDLFLLPACLQVGLHASGVEVQSAAQPAQVCWDFHSGCLGLTGLPGTAWRSRHSPELWAIAD